MALLIPQTRNEKEGLLFLIKALYEYYTKPTARPIDASAVLASPEQVADTNLHRADKQR
jgi:hypothetical protein